MADPAVVASVVPDNVLDHSLTIVNIVALVLVLTYQVLMRWFDYRSDRDDDQKMEQLIVAVGELVAAVQMKHVMTDRFQNDMTGTISGVRKMMKEILDRNAGVMNEDNSMRIIDQSFSNAVRDIVIIFTNSLETNGYEGREEFIRNRVKTTIGQVLDNLRNSLGYFQMSIDVGAFFRSEAMPDQSERYVLANQLWDLIEPFYVSKKPMKDKLEEVRLLIPNRIRDYLASTRNLIREHQLESEAAIT